MTGGTTADLLLAVTRALRTAGVPVSTGDSIVAARALDRVDLNRRREVRAALRSSLIKDVASAQILDRVLDRLLPIPSPEPHQPAPTGADLLQRIGEALGNGSDLTELAGEAVNTHGGLDDQVRGLRHHTTRTLRGLGLDALLRQLLDRRSGEDELERRLSAAEAEARVQELKELIERAVAARIGPVAPDAPTLADATILLADAAELAALRGALAPLARRLAARLGRRRRGRGSLDIRRTIRTSMGTGGVPVRPVLRRRHRTRPELAVLCDVSGSVAQFAPFTLALVYALRQEFGRVRAWVFIDGLVEITELLEDSRGFLDARRLLSRRGLVAGSGRSDYAAALQRFLADAGAVSARTSVLVVGDARSHDNPLPVAELDELRQRSRHVYWFNPEPRAEWDTDDSIAGLVARHVDAMYEVSTLSLLGDAVAAIA